jgi:hypothetical protein
LSKSQETQLKEKLKELEELLKRGKTEELPRFFSDISESERAAMAPTIIRWYRNSFPFDARTYLGLPEANHSDKQHISSQAAALALLATANADQLAGEDWSVLAHGPFNVGALVRIKPAAIRTFGHTLMAQDSELLRTVRDWYARNLIDKPQSDAYILALIGSTRFYVSRDERLFDWLLRNRDVIEQDIWRFFEIEGNQETSLASHDKYSSSDMQWSTALYQLAESGYISRQRLLLETLKALGRGFIQFRSGWFSRLHEDLKPTIEERIELIESYAQLLGSPIPPTVAFAVKALETIDKVQPLNMNLVERHISPCLAAQQKSTVSSALSLLERAVKRNQELSASACLLAAEALQHESPEIQTKAISLITKYVQQPNDALRNKITLYLDSLSPSSARKLNEWLGKTENDNLKKQTDLEKSPRERLLNSAPQIRVKYSMKAPQLIGWPLECLAKIAPIESVEELLNTAAYCLENPRQSLECERVLDGISRFPLIGKEERLQALAAPINKRAHKLTNSPPRTIAYIQRLFTSTVNKWLEPTKSIDFSIMEEENSISGRSLSTFMQGRLNHILVRVRSGLSVPLLSAPTHQGGWLDPAVFMERQRAWRKADAAPDEYDMAIALLRLPPNSYGELAAQPQLAPILTSALKYLSGEGSIDENTENIVWQAVKDAKPPVNPSEARVLSNDGLLCGAHDRISVRWRAIVAPSLRACEFTVAIRTAALLVSHPMQSHEHQVRDQFELLTESGAPFDRKALLLLNIGLIISDAESESFARDALILAIEEGRLDPSKLGHEISLFLYSERSRPKRLCKSLAEVARVSELHSVAVRQIIEHSLPGDASMAPPGLSSLLELLYELLIASGGQLETDEARKQLELLNKGGKTGALIKQLLARK